MFASIKINIFHIYIHLVSLYIYLILRGTIILKLKDAKSHDGNREHFLKKLKLDFCFEFWGLRPAEMGRIGVNNITAMY